MTDKDKFDALAALFQRLEQIADSLCDRANKALMNDGKVPLTCPKCRCIIEPSNWKFDAEKRILLCPNCGREINITSE